MRNHTSKYRAPIGPTGPAPRGQPASATSQGHSAVRTTTEGVPDLLAQARDNLDSNHPLAALEFVVEALRRTTGSEAGVLRALDEAKRQHRQVVASVDRPGENWRLLVPPSMEELNGEASVLAQAGQERILMDAASDGSSFLCPQCNELISVRRRDAHYQYWCTQESDSD